jgi:hypothetical protein
MSYNYELEKQQIFTDKGQIEFIKVRDSAMRLLDQAGAFMMFFPFKNIGVNGDSWKMMAYIDRMVEIGDIKEVTSMEYTGQHRVFIKNE